MFSRTFLSVSYRVSSKSHVTLKKVTCSRFLHLNCRNVKRDFIICTEQKNRIYAPTLTATFIRYASTNTPESTNATSTTLSDSNGLHTTSATSTTSSGSNISQATNLSDTEVISQIPEPPAPIVTPEVVEVLTGEPSLQSLGLGSWYPPGLIQRLLEYLHVSLDIPWWGCIVLTTVGIRLLLFPLVIKIQKITAKVHNVQPQIQYLQEKLTDARRMGDQMEVARLTHELYNFMKEKGVNPLKNALFPMMQAPVFLSFFMALRGMVQVPVDSMKEGGLWWFTDLTISDPYYILPIITSATLAATIEVGTDTVRIQSLGALRYLFRGVPLIIFPFIMNFEGAILCYWVSTNFISLIQVSILRIPKVRTYFEIPEMIKHDITKLPSTNKKFTQGFKDSWTNMKVARDLKSRQMYDESVFEKAGLGPVPKTYKFDPTKTRPITNTVLSKKRD